MADGAAFFLDAEEFGGVCRHCFEHFIGRDARGAPDGEIVPGHVGASFAGHFGDGVGGKGELHAELVGAGEAIDDAGADFIGVVVAGRWFVRVPSAAEAAFACCFLAAQLKAVP